MGFVFWSVNFFVINGSVLFHLLLGSRLSEVGSVLFSIFFQWEDMLSGGHCFTLLAAGNIVPITTLLSLFFLLVIEGYRYGGHVSKIYLHEHNKTIWGLLNTWSEKPCDE